MITGLLLNLTFCEIRIILPSIKEFEIDLFLVFHLYLLYSIILSFYCGDHFV